jgi:hypothetical protein
MNNKKPNPIGIILIEMLGCEIKELKPEVDQCVHSIQCLRNNFIKCCLVK